jgi:hypothetical protein
MHPAGEIEARPEVDTRETYGGGLFTPGFPSGGDSPFPTG